MTNVLFAVFQSSVRANGGVESITQVLTHLGNPNNVVVTQLETPHTKRWRALGLTTFIWPLSLEAGQAKASPWATLKRLWDFIRYNARVAVTVRRRRIGVVHCNDILSVHLCGWGAKLAGAKVVHNLRDIKKPGVAYGWRWRLAGRLVDTTLTLSREMAEEAERRFLPKNARSRHIYSIVDPEMQPPSAEERQQCRAQLGIPKDTILVTTVASWVAKKAQATFIEQCAAELTSECTLAFVGDGDPSYEARGRKAAEPYGSAIRFVGHTTAIRDWYWASDIVVLASQHEGLARCMIESLSCGTPVVSFDVCSAREILCGHDCGEVVPQGDYQQLSRVILALVHDPGLRKNLGTRGARLQQQLFEPRLVGAQYQALYEGLTKSSTL